MLAALEIDSESGAREAASGNISGEDGVLGWISLPHIGAVLRHYAPIFD